MRAARARAAWGRGRRGSAGLGLCLCLCLCSACLSFGREPTRRYYVLSSARAPSSGTVIFPGLVRVRDLDAESAYDRFQLVLRKSPYELAYRQRDVWAVKPSRMVADIVAGELAADNLFAGVTRELSERRPQFLVSGELHAIEVVDEGRGGWAVRLALSLTLSHSATGATLWNFHFDHTEAVGQRDFPACIEALSTLTREAMARACLSLRQLPHAGGAAAGS